MRHGVIGLLVIALVGTLTALTTVSASTPSQPEQRATLPPSWTPTFTPTASPTRTPTLTPSITPTLTEIEVCDELVVMDTYDGRRYYDYDETVIILFGTELRGTTMRATVEHRLGQEGVLIPTIEQIPLTTLNIPISALPRHGLYDWSIELLDDEENVLCEKGGLFVAGFPITETPTPVIPENITQTPNVIIVTATPVFIVVTATPSQSPEVEVTATP
jgi:hypothetical protein